MSAAALPVPERTDPIFILSPLPRCGTNFLWDLLRLHPHCSAGRSPIWEDYLLKNAQPLFEFVDAAQGCWDPAWGPTGHLRQDLLRHIGRGLIEFMTVDADRRVVLKSPSFRNLEHFFDLWPGAYLLLLVRDGRDVVHSGMGTFGWTLHGGARWWAKEISRMESYLSRSDVPKERVRVVRYEDLVQDEAEPDRILEFLDLPVELFDRSKANALPIRGSSTHRGGSDRDRVHWDPVERTADFEPVRRWRTWDPDSVDVFSSIAERELGLLGYPSASG